MLYIIGYIVIASVFAFLYSFTRRYIAIANKESKYDVDMTLPCWMAVFWPIGFIYGAYLLAECAVIFAEKWRNNEK